MKRIAERKKVIIVCLDEFDQLKEFNILYTLLRNGFGIILISSNTYSLAKLDSRIKSSLALTGINFSPCTINEIYDIFKG